MNFDAIQITGEVDLIQDGKVICTAKNHIVGQGLGYLLGFLSASYFTGYSDGTMYVNFPISAFRMQFGRNEANPTVYSMTACASPVSLYTNTNAFTLVKDPITDGTDYIQIAFNCAIDGATLSAALTAGDVITEMGLFVYGILFTAANYYYDSATTTLGGSYWMLARIGHGDFDGTQIDWTKALAVSWKYKFAFN